MTPVTGDWSETGTNSVTGAPPAVNSANAFTATIKLSAKHCYNVDITNIIKNWLDSGTTIRSIMIETTSGEVVFDSKENTDTSHLAYVDITLAGPAGPTGAAGPQGDTGLQGLQGATGSNMAIIGGGMHDAPPHSEQLFGLYRNILIPRRFHNKDRCRSPMPIAGNIGQFYANVIVAPNNNSETQTWIFTVTNGTTATSGTCAASGNNGNARWVAGYQ